MKKAEKIKYFLVITLVAFLMNTLLPFFAVYNLPQAVASEQEQSSAKEMASLFGEKVLICTSEGFKWVSGTDLQSGKEKPKPHPQYKCPLCYVAAHGMKHAMPAMAVELVYAPVEQKLAYVFPASETVQERLFIRNYPSRAPPAFIIA